ncbi:MAG: hypothetical protein HY683_04570 [Chloroflexi bacterium]|nr:hypothetical protein [Chloroflexota bacterium]
MTRSLKHSVRLGRFGLPLWAVALAVVIIGAAAGQAIGPVLAGAVTGTAGVVAEQSIVLHTDTYASSHGGNDDALAVINDEGTSFTAAIEQHMGDTETVLVLNLSNVSNDGANALLTLNVPAGVDVEVESLDANLEEAQMTANTWLLKEAAGGPHELEITIESKDDAAPGFYTITGSIVQIGG